MDNTINPIAAVVEPLKAKAMDAAEVAMRASVERVLKALEAVDWDVNAEAPYPNWNMSREKYRQAQRYYNFVRRITRVDQSRPYTMRPSDPCFCEMYAEGIENEVAMARLGASAGYDSYVAKLIGKVGDVIDARLVLVGGLWQDSNLIVTKPDGTTETWNTKVIVNCSVLGLLFNQWPTRKLKR